MALSRRMFLRDGLAGSIVRIGLPPLAAMFNGSGTAYAAAGRTESKAIESRFVLWFKGNGIPEKYWIPRTTGADFEFTPCLAPLTPYRQDIHVITGLDSPAARLPGPGNSHYPSMSALVSGQPARAAARVALRSIRQLPASWARNRDSARCRLAYRRSRSAKVFSGI